MSEALSNQKFRAKSPADELNCCIDLGNSIAIHDVHDTTNVKKEDIEGEPIISAMSNQDDAYEKCVNLDERSQSISTLSSFATHEYGHMMFGMYSFIDWSQPKDRRLEAPPRSSEAPISLPFDDFPKHYVTKYLSLPWVSIINQNCQVEEITQLKEMESARLDVVASPNQCPKNLQSNNDISADFIEMKEDEIIGKSETASAPKYRVNARVDNNLKSGNYRFSVWKIDPNCEREQFSSVIERDFEAFEAFHSVLTTSCDIVAVIVPPLPQLALEGKSYIFTRNSCASNELKNTLYFGNITKDCSRLNWYMDKIIKHPILGQSDIISEFLEHAEFHSTLKQRLIMKKNKLIMRFLSFIRKRFYQKWIEKNALLLKESEWASEYEHHIHSLKDAQCELIKSQCNISNQVISKILHFYRCNLTARTVI